MTTLLLNDVENKLFEETDIQQATLYQAMNEINRYKVDFADIFFQSMESESWSLLEGRIQSASYQIDRGVGIRAVSHDKTAYAFSNIINNRELLNASNVVRSISTIGESKTIDLRSETNYPAMYEPISPLESLDAIKKVEILRKVDEWAHKKDIRVKEVMASLHMTSSYVLIIRSDGREVFDVRPLIRLNISVIMEENGKRETGNAGGGARTGLQYFTDELIQEYIDQALYVAETNLHAQDVRAGEMEVVLGPGWPGVLLHEAVGHGLEGDFNRKKTSVFSGKIGEQVAHKGVTVVDQGNIPNRRGSLTVDDEGNPTQRTVLIEDGILKGYLQDEMNARLMNMPLTGNGRREDYASSPLPRMTNTFMEAGAYDKEEIISSMKKGLYAENFGGGSVDITSGRFVFNTSVAWYVEDGKILYPVKNATLIGNGPDVMKHVTMIGNDLELDSGVGVCGKSGQSVEVGVGQPTLKVERGLIVGGTTL